MTCRYLSAGPHLLVFSVCSFPCTSFVSLLPLVVPVSGKEHIYCVGDWRQLLLLLICGYDLLDSYLTMLTNATVIWIALVWEIWAESSPLMAKMPFTFGPVKKPFQIILLGPRQPKAVREKGKEMVKIHKCNQLIIFGSSPFLVGYLLTFLLRLFKLWFLSFYGHIWVWMLIN